MDSIQLTEYQKQAFAVCPRSGLSFIEQLQISSSKPCPKTNVPYLIGVNENDKISILTKASCKMWNCEPCAARIARTWIAKIINGTNRLGGEWSFLTVTAHRSFRKEKSIGNIRNGWKKLYNRILEKASQEAEDLHYAKVWEQQADGTFHLHLLVSVCYGTRWAKDNAASCGLGFMDEWHTVDNAGMVAGYVAKYTLKNAILERGGVAWPKGLRRIETSRQWPVLGKKEQISAMGWIVKFDRDSQLRTAQVYHMRGFDIVDTVKE